MAGKAVRRTLRLSKWPVFNPPHAGRFCPPADKQRIADLFDHRHRFVPHGRTPAEKKTLRRITRGLPRLRALREIRNEVYRRLDRRGRTDTALAKLAKPRRRVRRFPAVDRTLQKRFSPNLEKARGLSR
jgi:hypothetical protein